MTRSQPVPDDIPVLVIGEALIDIVTPLAGAPYEHVGGSPANVAVGLARLGHPTSLATWFGRDQRGQCIRELMLAEGVTVTTGSDAAPHTSTALARLDAERVATYEFDVDWQLPDKVEAKAGHLHTGSLAATLAPGGDSVAHLIDQRRATATISYDPNARPSLMGEPTTAAGTIEHFISMADVVKASEEDVHWLYAATPEVAIAHWATLGPRLVLITLGPQGVLASINGMTEHFPAVPTAVADTVGAGDSFMSGLLSGLLDAHLLGGSEARTRLATAQADDVRPAIERALACAGVTVSRVGSNPPRRDELMGDASRS